MNKLERAKEIIKEYYDMANCGIFDTRNIFGDRMTTIYEDDELVVDICYGYSYFEVFGLSDEEFNELEKYYSSLEEEE